MSDGGMCNLRINIWMLFDSLIIDFFNLRLTATQTLEKTVVSLSNGRFSCYYYCI